MEPLLEIRLRSPTTGSETFRLKRQVRSKPSPWRTNPGAVPLKNRIAGRIKSPWKMLMVVALGALSGAGPGVLAADPAPNQAEITKTAEAFVEAFHRGDAKAVSEMWTPDGDFVDLEGRVMKGRAAIEKDFTRLFQENKGLKLRIDVASVRFVAPDTAIEDGTSTVLAPDNSAPSRARYTNVLVKREGKWLLSSVREAPYLAPTKKDNLRDLEWMLGEWVDPGSEGHVAHAVFEMSPDRNFILSLRAVKVDGSFLDNGTQRIGWDPAAKQFRSWSFEPDGGFGEGVWTKNADGTWTVKTNSTLQSGHKVSATTTVTRVDPDTVTWQTKDQLVDGKSVPDTAVVTMKRIQK